MEGQAVRLLSRGLVLVALLGTTLASPAQANQSAIPEAAGPALEAPAAVSDRTTCPGSATTAITNLTGKTSDAVEQAQWKYQDTAGFRAAIYDGMGVVIVVDQSSASDWAARLQGTGLRIAASCVDTALVAAADATASGTKVAAGDYIAAGYDGLHDAVIVNTTLDAGDIARAMSRELVKHGRQDLSHVVENTKSKGTVRIAHSEHAVRRASRTTDTSPFFGGGRIRDTFGGCTTGFYINSTTNGTVMVTAGHCTNGQNGITWFNGDGSASLGASEGVHFPDPDLGLIDGSGYASDTFGGNNQTTVKSVTASADPATGVTYCQYGATSLRKCYAYTSLNYQFCDSSGCTNNLAFSSGPAGPGGSLSSAGDSGGGVFKELTSTTVSARGIVIGNGCSATVCQTVDHKRQTILSTYNATVVLH